MRFCDQTVKEQGHDETKYDQKLLVQKCSIMQKHTDSWFTIYDHSYLLFSGHWYEL